MDLKEIFARCEKLSYAKRADYTSSTDFHENFKRSASLSQWFIREQDKAYVILIGTKLARLASLLGQDKTPNNESIEDSFLDLVNYCALWAERVSSERMQDSQVDKSLPMTAEHRVSWDTHYPSNKDSDILQKKHYEDKK